MSATQIVQRLTLNQANCKLVFSFIADIITHVMLIIKAQQKLSPKSLAQIGRILKSGGAVVFPTDTAYGLGVDATNPKAVAKVYKIKHRQQVKPLSVMVSDINHLAKIARMNKDAIKLIKAFWPGALTLILKRKSGLAHNLNPNNNTIAIRYPDCQIANQLCQSLEKPITATSANLAQKGNLYSAKQIIKIFSRQNIRPDVIINAGRLKKIKPSTIVDLTSQPYRIVRQGPVKPEDIEKVLCQKVNH